MILIRRQLLRVAAALIAIPSTARIVFAQTPAGPKLAQILKKDIEGQDRRFRKPSSALSTLGRALRRSGTCIQARRRHSMRSTAP